jgi:hypothetical protein
MRRIAIALVLTCMTAVAVQAAEPIDGQTVQPSRDARPGVLPSLYVGLAALHAFDIYSTSTAIRNGGREGNPLMVGIVGHPLAFVAVDSAAAGASIFAAERLWRHRHRAQAIALMAASNGIMAIVAAHNATVLGRLR